MNEEIAALEFGKCNEGKASFQYVYSIYHHLLITIFLSF